MERSRGDYSSAYKLSRAAKDTSKQRLHRRSLEQKELRQEQVDRRRNINDLSPVLEGDVSQQQQSSKDYRGRTPTRPTNTQSRTAGKPAQKGSEKKTNDRMEMLKRWKAEREEKKKAEQNVKKGTFRVSKTVERKELDLYKKNPQSNQVKTHAAPSRNQSAPTKPHTATAAPGPRAGTQSHTATAGHRAESQSHTAADMAHQRPAVQAHSTTDRARTRPVKQVQGKTATLRSRSPRAPSIDPNKGKLKSSTRQPTGKVPEVVHHNTRQPRQPVAATRVTRGATKAKVSEPVSQQDRGKSKGRAPATETTSSHKKANTEMNEPKPQEEKMDVSINLTKVTVRNANPETMDSFAPSDCTFNAPANLASFVFKPLSPASAASFLYPNQDTCSSFLDTIPNRASTPKSGDKVDSTSTTLGDKTQVEENTVVQLEATEVEAHTPSEQEEERSPIKPRRSSRRSISLTAESDSEPMSKQTPSRKRRSVAEASDSKMEVVVLKPVQTVQSEQGSKPPTPARSRRSVGGTADSSSANEQVMRPTPSRSSRKTRRSALPTVSETDTNSESDKESDQNVAEVRSQSSKKARRSLRRSVLETMESDKTESSEEERGSPSKRRRTRRSIVSMESHDSGTETELVSDSKQDNTETPSRSLRRSSRRSNISSVSEEDNSQENKENIENCVELVSDSKPDNSDTPSRSLRRSSRRSNISSVSEEDNIQENKENIENSVESRKDFALKAFGSTSETQGSSNTTPARQKGRAGRKTFGGFAVPDSNSKVLSSKRSARKSMMPKSPEEWVELLNHSPMVEMTRRTPKSSTSSSKSPNAPIPTLNFDDIDFENILVPSTTEPSTPQAVNDTKTNLTQPMATLNLALNETASSPRPAVDEVPVVETRTAKIAEEVVQVEEISSTQDGLSSDGENVSGEHDVKYFRNLLKSEKKRLNGLCSTWEDINDSTGGLTEEIRGQIRTTIGQAMLLMDQRFKQFSGLVDNCEFSTGEKETTCTDLQGFWDMVYFQVEDVNAKFDSLAKLEENNWKEDKPEPVAKKVVKKKAIKPAAPKVNVKSKFAAFRAQMKKQQQEPPGSPALIKEEEKVFEVPGFFKVASPVRSPKPHCEAGTPKKSKPVEEAPSSSGTSDKDTLKLPSDQPGSGSLLNRTPARKSYAPVIPSPLLQDTTPVPRPMRSCTKKTPIPKRLLEDTASLGEGSSDGGKKMEVTSPRERNTPRRRSLRTRKSVTFGEAMEQTAQDSPISMLTASPVVEGTDSDFARLLQPVVTSQETDVTSQETDDNVVDEVDDFFSKYLQPTTRHNTSIEKENSPKESQRRRRPSLKSTKSSEKRRSRGHSVHFVSPVTENSENVSLPHTPYNRDSLVKQKRVTRGSLPSPPKMDVFDIENIDNENSIPSPVKSQSSRRSARPSLLYTPPKKQKTTPSNKNVPTATLISFSP